MQSHVIVGGCSLAEVATPSWQSSELHVVMLLEGAKYPSAMNSPTRELDGCCIARAKCSHHTLLTQH